MWVSLRGKTKVAESKMEEFKMAAINKLSHNEWVKVFLFVQMVGTNLGKCEWVWEEKTKVAESMMVEFKMAAIIKLSQNELDWVGMN